MTLRSLLVCAVLSLVFAGLVVAVRWNSLRVADLRMARKHRDRFFRVVEQLVADPRTPEPLAQVLLLMAAGMTRRILPYLMLIGYGRRSGTEDLVLRIDELPQELRPPVIGAILDAVCVLTYQNVLIGPLVRRRLCLDDNRSKKDNGTTPKVERLAGTVARFELRHTGAA